MSKTGQHSARESKKGIGRRKFLLGTAAVVAAAGLVRYAGKPFVKDELRPTFDLKQSPGYLLEREMITIFSLLEVLVPRKLWSADEDMIFMVNKATMGQKGVLKAYKDGVQLLDTLATRQNLTGFSQASFKDRERILESLMWKFEAADEGELPKQISKIQKRLERFSQSEPERRFRELVVRDLLIRFYAGERAWKMARYANFPGNPGNPRAYTKAMKSL